MNSKNSTSYFLFFKVHGNSIHLVCFNNKREQLSTPLEITTLLKEFMKGNCRFKIKLDKKNIIIKNILKRKLRTSLVNPFYD